MGLRSIGLVAILLSILLLFPSGSISVGTVRAQFSGEFPISMGIGKTDANYDQITERFYADIDERVQVFFNVEIRNASSEKNPTVHIVAYLAGFDRPDYGEQEKNPEAGMRKRGNESMVSYDRTKDACIIDYEPTTFKELVDRNAATIVVNFTFHTAGQWVIRVIYELSPGQYYFTYDGEQSITIKERDQDTGFLSLMLMASIFMFLAVIADLIHRRFMGIGKATSRKWMGRRRNAIIAVISIFIVFLLVFYSLFYVLMPRPTYVQMISEMDGTADSQGRVHVAWIKHIEDKYSNSMDDMMRNGQFMYTSGSLFYSRIEQKYSEVRTIPISTETKSQATSVKLVLDKEEHPHIFWMSMRAGPAQLNHVEVRSNGLGPVQSIKCIQMSMNIHVEMVDNGTFFVSGCNGLIAILPDGTTWSDQKLFASGMFLAPDGALHIISQRWDNETNYLEHMAISKEGNITVLPINVTPPKGKGFSVVDMAVLSDGDLMFMSLMSDYYSGTGSTAELRIYRCRGNSTNSSMIFSQTSDEHNYYDLFTAMNVFDDEIYGFYSGLETYDKKTYHLFHSMNGTAYESKVTPYRFWDFVMIDGRVYGIGQIFWLQPMKKNLEDTIVIVPTDWS